MYQALVHKSFAAVDLMVELREWFRPYWLLVTASWAVAMVVLFYLYVSPHTPPPTVMVDGLNIEFDKVCHIFAHASLLALPLALIANRRLAWTMAFMAIGAGFCFEFAQLFVPERTFDFADLTANFAGLVIGARGGRFIREL